MEKLVQAIEQRRLVEFTYDRNARVVVPAAVGYHASTGNAVLRGYQIRGTSNSRAVPLWDLFLLPKIAGLVILAETFTDLPPGYARTDKHISPLLAQL